MKTKFLISPPDRSLREALQQKVDTKTKPLGALGVLEDIAIQIGLIQGSLQPRLTNPHLIVFAGDHGVAEENVSAYPQEVTWQMVANFLNGGAAINVFCKQHDIELKVVDAGVNHDFPKDAKGLIHNKTGKSTANFANGPAMSIEQVQVCIATSAALVREITDSGCNIIGFGEMGIANTSSASMLMSVLCNLPLEKCIGRGTGLDDSMLKHKLEVLQKSLTINGKPNEPLKVMATFGGFEIAQMVGAILQSAESKLIILIDGFIATTAYLVAQAIEPAVKDYCIFCHQSQEQGHKLLLEYLEVNPLLNLGMRLGEGTGVAVAFPIVQSAVYFLNEMANFEDAGVTNKP